MMNVVENEVILLPKMGLVDFLFFRINVVGEFYLPASTLQSQTH